MTISNIESASLNTVSSLHSATSQGSSGTSALKGAMEMQEMIQGTLAQMMRDITPHLGQNLDIEV